MKHYLVITLPAGEHDVTRVYWPLEAEDESADDALDRWVKDCLKGRKTRGKLYDAAERALRGSVLYARVTHPSSWWAAREEAGQNTQRPRSRSRKR